MEAKKKRRPKIFGTEWNICRVSEGQAAQDKESGQRWVLLSVKSCEKSDFEEPIDFPHIQRVLMVVRSGEESQRMWGMIDEVVKDIMKLLLAITDNEELKKLLSFCYVRAPEHYYCLSRMIVGPKALQVGKMYPS